MSYEENKHYVLEGLAERRIRRQEAEQEARLDEYEQAMLTACNGNHLYVRNQRKVTEEDLQRRRQRDEQHRLRMEQLRKQRELEEDAQDTVKRYALICLMICLVACWTPLEWWAALTLMAGLAVFPMAYIYRLYCPIRTEGGMGYADR